MNIIHIGSKIKHVFSASGLSVSEFARRIQTTRQNIYGIFSRSSIDTALLQRICTALNYDFFKLYVQKGSLAEDEKFEYTTSPATGGKRMVLQIEIDEKYYDEILKLTVGSEAKEIIIKALK